MSKSKSEVSQDFAKFEARNNNALKEAREQEKQSYSNPFPIGYSGVAVLSSARGFGAGQNKIPTGLVEATCINDPAYEGKTFAAAIRQFKDTEKQTAAEAYANFLDNLEEIGLQRETREQAKTIGEMFDELLSTPHYVAFNVVKNTYTRDGKAVQCSACPPPEGMSGHTPTPQTAADTSEPEDELDTSDLEQVVYLGKPHWKLEPANEDGTVNLKQVKGGKLRHNIPVEELDD